jgi:hypothetical protein
MRVEFVSDVFQDNLSCREAVIIGGGSSVNEFDFSLLEKQRLVIGVNDSFKLGSFVGYVWFGDQRWYEWNKEFLKEYRESKKVYTCAESLEDNPDLQCFKRGKPLGVETTLNKVSWNRTSGASAINFAYHLGARKIILIGFDMKRGNKGETHWHDNHKKKDADIDTLFLRYLEPFKAIKRDADKLGVKIVNLNLNSAIEDFPKMTYKEAINW